MSLASSFWENVKNDEPARTCFFCWILHASWSWHKVKASLRLRLCFISNNDGSRSHSKHVNYYYSWDITWNQPLLYYNQTHSVRALRLWWISISTGHDCSFGPPDTRSDNIRPCLPYYKRISARKVSGVAILMDSFSRSTNNTRKVQVCVGRATSSIILHNQQSTWTLNQSGNF